MEAGTIESVVNKADKRSRSLIQRKKDTSPVSIRVSYTELGLGEVLFVRFLLSVC